MHTGYRTTTQASSQRVQHNSTQHPYMWHTYTQGAGTRTQGTRQPLADNSNRHANDTMSMRGEHPCHEHAHASVRNPDVTTCNQSPNAGNTGHSVTPTNGQPHPPSAHAQQPNRNAEPPQ